MIRNLKVLGLVALTVAALSAVAASAAQAGPHFVIPGAGSGTTTLKITADDENGTNAKTGHRVFDISKADGTGVKSITCNQIHADATVTGETIEEITFNTPTFTGECQFVGQTVVIEDTGCEYIFTANTTLDIENSGALKCEHGQKPIHFSISGCKVEVGRQTNLGGLKYQNVTTHNKKAITIEMNITGIVYNATGVNCEYGTTINGRLTTGNAIAIGERAGAFVDIEWTG
jgi:hypothetical protein